MAQIKIECGKPQKRILIDGHDVTHSVFGDSIELVRVGDERLPEAQEWGIRMTFAVTDLATLDEYSGRLAADAAAERSAS